MMANGLDIPSNDLEEVRDYLSRILPNARFSSSQIQQISKLDCAERLAFWANGHPYKIANEEIPHYCNLS